MNNIKLYFNGGIKNITVSVGNQYWTSAPIHLPEKVTIEVAIKRRYVKRLTKKKSLRDKMFKDATKTFKM